MLDMESIRLSPELLFSACNEHEVESMGNSSDAPMIDTPEHLSLSSLSEMTTSVVPTQDFDLVKNILSEIFDTSDEKLSDENLTELLNIDQHEDLLAMPTTISNNNDDDFRFLDDMLASIDVSDAAIHEMTPAEIDRVDLLLKDIVSAQQTEETSPSSLVNERESPPSSSFPLPERLPSPTDESSTSSLPTMNEALASSPPIDEELVRVEQEWAQLSEDDKKLGSIAPEWVNDDQAPACMKCTNRFSITRRRHHCRACGKVYCATCCWQKAKLIHDDNKEDRTCNDCVKTMNRGRLTFVRENLIPLVSCFYSILPVEYLWTYMRNNQKPRTSVLRKRTGNSSWMNPFRSATNRRLARRCTACCTGYSP